VDVPVPGQGMACCAEIVQTAEEGLVPYHGIT
jgi:hypothetical protein